eukprot:3607421-Alexandrium_andersonii.AAC.1
MSNLAHPPSWCPSAFCLVAFRPPGALLVIAIGLEARMGRRAQASRAPGDQFRIRFWGPCRPSSECPDAVVHVRAAGQPSHLCRDSLGPGPPRGKYDEFNRTRFEHLSRGLCANLIAAISVPVSASICSE